MISCIMVSAFLAVCMATFFTINLHNIMSGTRVRRAGIAYAEVEHPHGILYSMAAFSTLIFFVLSVLYVILSLCGAMEAPILASIQLPNSEFVQGMGIVPMATGYTLFISSVIVRGRYSVSWEMPEDHKLIMKRFGPEYEIYRKNTGRFVPKVYKGRT